jgi:hypothetical protein
MPKLQPHFASTGLSSSKIEIRGLLLHAISEQKFIQQTLSLRAKLREADANSLRCLANYLALNFDWLSFDGKTQNNFETYTVNGGF